MRLTSNSIFSVSFTVKMGELLYYILCYNGTISAILGEATYCVGV